MTTTTEEIVIQGPQPLVIDPASAKRRPALTEEEARLLTAEIQRTSVRLWLLVSEAHDRAAHMAMGYDSWDDYVRSEFKMSPSRSYQLLDTGHLMRELAVAGVDIDHMTPPPTRIVSRLKSRLPEVRRATKAALKSGTDPQRALRDLAREPRERTEAPAPPAQRDGGPDEPTTPRRASTVTCPACEGEGAVTRSLGNRLRAFLKNLN